ncbi:hypothetical protein B0H14DRAFT_2826877 [Mycena olivaceomarginata]|nr:hypothetical protein B0H14DRAFT_2826877 [Mycena olivaceomarginata]
MTTRWTSRFKCSVWPSLFTQGQVWPAQGEIDIIVNLETNNRFSLHVGDDNCVQPTSIASNQTGTISTASGSISNCNRHPCHRGFATQGGGVYAMSWDTSGIAMWYFPRASASAWYPAASCDPTKAFGSQIITLYIDICGAFAGVQSLFEPSCSSVAPNCSAAVPDPANYNNAYWDINYLRTYTTGAVTTTNNTAKSASASGSSTSSGAGSNPTGTGAATSLRAAAGIRELLLVPASLLLLGLLNSL